MVHLSHDVHACRCIVDIVIFAHCWPMMVPSAICWKLSGASNTVLLLHCTLILRTDCPVMLSSSCRASRVFQHLYKMWAWWWSAPLHSPQTEPPTAPQHAACLQTFRSRGWCLWLSRAKGRNVSPVKPHSAFSFPCLRKKGRSSPAENMWRLPPFICPSVC